LEGVDGFEEEEVECALFWEVSWMVDCGGYDDLVSCFLMEWWGDLVLDSFFFGVGREVYVCRPMRSAVRHGPSCIFGYGEGVLQK
jgi:hypothetical protein